jgi:hypothetical protein
VIDLKRITVPVFLVYAGIIHAIGLALLLPMLITLPGPGSMITPKGAPVDVEPDAAERDRDVTSALSAPPRSVHEAATDAALPVEPDTAPDAPGNIANLLPPTSEEDMAADEIKAPAPQASGKAKANNAKPATTVRKAVAQRRPTARRSAKRDVKIAPFGGGMSGLFTPGAPAKRR